MGKARLEEQAQSLDLKMFGELALRACAEVLKVGAPHSCADRAHKTAGACQNPLAPFSPTAKVESERPYGHAVLVFTWHTSCRPREGTDPGKLHKRNFLLFKHKVTGSLRGQRK